jgi:pyruvate/2-oxoglutarate dehydrogenase complex dihydrolipoamide dehydrogenase (E3) component
MSEAEQQPPGVREYDVVVLGAGSTGENVADRARRGGLSVVVVEDELVGGECSYWACMPSKALLRPGAVLAAARAVPGAADAVTGGLDAAGVLARRNTFASHWDDHGQVEWLAGAGIALVRGRARFAGPRTVVVEDDMGLETVLRARHAVVVATGSEPALPDVDGLAVAAPWTSREATSAQEVPASLTILGGGVVAVEMAVAYADLGAAVTVLVRGDRMLARAEPFAGREVADALLALGVDLRTGSAVTSVRRAPDGVHVTLADGGEVVSEQLLVATGRAPRTADLGLAVLGLRPGAPLEVDDAMAVGAVAGGWLFAAGDVTGRTSTTHQGKYDGRVAGDVVAARFGTSDADRQAEESAGRWTRYRASADGVGAPQVVFSRPEVAWVGLTEQAAREAGLDVRVVQYDMSAVSGASVAADGYAGTAQLVLDDARGLVVGATFTGPDAAELVHAATVVVVGQVPLDRLWHAVPAYPTVSEVWLRLLETAGL